MIQTPTTTTSSRETALVTRGSTTSSGWARFFTPPPSHAYSPTRYRLLLYHDTRFILTGRSMKIRCFTPRKKVRFPRPSLNHRPTAVGKCLEYSKTFNTMAKEKRWWAHPFFGLEELTNCSCPSNEKQGSSISTTSRYLEALNNILPTLVKLLLPLGRCPGFVLYLDFYESLPITRSPSRHRKAKTRKIDHYTLWWF